MPEDVKVMCKKCKNKAPASVMKLDLDERMMICPECVKNKKIHREIQEEAFHKEKAKVQQMQQNTATESYEKNEEKSNKVGHKCASCGYKFMINPEMRSPKSCPYCNSKILSF